MIVRGWDSCPCFLSWLAHENWRAKDWLKDELEVRDCLLLGEVAMKLEQGHVHEDTARISLVIGALLIIVLCPCATYHTTPRDCHEQSGMSTTYSWSCDKGSLLEMPEVQHFTPQLLTLDLWDLPWHGVANIVQSRGIVLQGVFVSSAISLSLYRNWNSWKPPSENHKENGFCRASPFSEAASAVTNAMVHLQAT